MLNKSGVFAICMVLAWAVTANQQALEKPLILGNADEGKVLPNGQPAVPLIAGQLPGYFVKSMYDYKTDKRADPLMNAISKGLTDVDIANLAVFYASLSNK